jgi:hypothetical protein
MAQAILNSFPRNTQLKVMRRRLLQHDLDMFAAISGHTPRTPLPEEPHEEAVRVATAAKAKPWSASVLSNYLGHIPMTRIAARAVSPEVADWMRKLSTHALERLQQAQVRLHSARESSRLRPRADVPETRCA